jgi:hypothetical protein
MKRIQQVRDIHSHCWNIISIQRSVSTILTIDSTTISGVRSGGMVGSRKGGVEEARVTAADKPGFFAGLSVSYFVVEEVPDPSLSWFLS